jgi:hypothetical protein
MASWMNYIVAYDQQLNGREERNWVVCYFEPDTTRWMSKTAGHQVIIEAECVSEAYMKMLEWWGITLEGDFEGEDDFELLSDSDRDRIAARRIRDMTDNDTIWLEPFNPIYL